MIQDVRRVSQETMHSPYRLEIGAAVWGLPTPTFSSGDVGHLLKARNGDARKVTENLQAFQAAGLLTRNDTGGSSFWHREPSVFWSLCARFYDELLNQTHAQRSSDPMAGSTTAGAD